MNLTHDPRVILEAEDMVRELGCTKGKALAVLTNPYTDIGYDFMLRWITLIVGPERLLGWQGGRTLLSKDDDPPRPVWVLTHQDSGSGSYYFMSSDVAEDTPGMYEDYAHIPGVSEIEYQYVRDATKAILVGLLTYGKAAPMGV